MSGWHILMAKRKKIDPTGSFLGAAIYSLSLISTLWSCTDNGSPSRGQIKYINKINENKCCHCVVFKPEVITSQGDISIHPQPRGASQITISHTPTNKEPTQIHSCARSQFGDLLHVLIMSQIPGCPIESVFK